MKKILLLITVLFLGISLSFSQGTPVKTVRIADATTVIGENLSVGNQVYNIATGELWIVNTATASTETLTTASSNFDIVNGSGITNLGTGTVTGTTYEITSSTGDNLIMPAATVTEAGLLTGQVKQEIEANTTHASTTSGNPHSVTKSDVGLANVPNTDFTAAVAANTAKVGITSQQAADIEANNAKITNAVHTGDVTGGLALTIGADKVKETMIDWGAGAGQVSTDDLPEGSTNWWYTDARVAANSAVVANTAKVTNATHTGDVTGSGALTIGADKVKDSHIDWGTGVGQVSTTDITEGTKLFYTDARVSANADVVANTAKISYTDASDVAANTTHSTTTTGNPHSVTKADVGLGSVPNTDFTSAVAANTAKVTNATHTGDVTGSGALTIGADKVKDTHIDWGTGAGQVSTSDITEGTKLFYTEARVSANASVAANTAKTGITAQQAADITANNAKVGITTTQANAITANTAKVTNQTHTGDVSGSTTLTIGNDKVDDVHINWGTSAGQVSTADMPESGNLYYTDARVSANAAVAANTAKISYTDAAAVSSNTTHRTTTTGNPHSVTKSDVGLGNVPNTDLTAAVAANTAKTTNQPTSLSIGTKTTTTMGITSDGGANDVVLSPATGTEAGLLTSALYNKIQGIASGADNNFVLFTESFEEDNSTPTAHSLSHTAQTAGAVVSLNGQVLDPSDYTLTSSTLTIGLAVLQYDKVTVTYNY